jgi:hypothetical protein
VRGADDMGIEIKPKIKTPRKHKTQNPKFDFGI